ncbi:MAG: hypothetical protein RLP44_25140 [Aggregatilineales bacterium]
MSRFGAIVAFLFFLPAMCIFQIFASINSFAFNSDFYASFLDNPQIYEDMSREIGLDPELIEQIPDREMREAILSVASPEALRETVTTAIRDIFDAGFDGRDSVRITIDISTLQEYLDDSSSEIQADFLERMASITPQCEIGQSPNFSGYPLPVCISPNLTQEQFTQSLLDDRTNIMADFPTSIMLDLDMGWSQEDASIFQLRETMSGTMRTAGIIAMVIWAFSAWLFAKNVHGRFRWLGITLLIPSIMMIVASILFSQALISTVGQATTAIGTVNSDVADTIGGGISKIGWSFFFSGFIPAIIGGILFAYGSNKNVRSAFRQGRSAASGAISAAGPAFQKFKESPSESLTVMKDSVLSATEKTRENLNNVIQSDGAQKIKENLGNVATSAKDRVSTIVQSDSAQKTKDGLGTATEKAKENLSNAMKSESAQKAKENIGNAANLAKDSLSNFAQSDTAQKAKERFGKFTQGFMNSKTEEPAKVEELVTLEPIIEVNEDLGVLPVDTILDTPLMPAEDWSDDVSDDDLPTP